MAEESFASLLPGLFREDTDFLLTADPDPQQLGPDGVIGTRLRLGGRVVLTDLGMPALKALDWAGVQAAPLPPVAAENPLVRAEKVVAEGCGLWAALWVSLTEMFALNGEPLACALGQVVAAEFAVGAGRLIVLPGEWTRQLGRDDNAVAVIRAATGAIGSAAERDVLTRREQAGQAFPHPAAEELRAKDWDLSLLELAGDDPDAAAFVRAAGHAGRLLPADVHDALVDFADGSNEAGALVIHGVPVGDLPSTPPTPTSVNKSDRVSEFALLTVARRLGQPVGYAPEHGGALVQNISPVESDAHRQLSTSSRSTLAFHTEAAFHPHRPRFLLLLCLRGDPSAATTLCSVQCPARRVEPAGAGGPRDPAFHDDVGRVLCRGPRPRVARCPARSSPATRRIRSSGSMPTSCGVPTTRRRQALERLSELASEQATGVVLEAGDLLVVDNDIAVHGRTPFQPRFDGTDRWLQRTFVVTDHTAADGERDGRIIRTRFLA